MAALLDDAEKLRTRSAYEELCIRCARQFVVDYAAGSDTDLDTLETATRQVVAQVMEKFGLTAGQPHAGLAFVCEHQAVAVLERVERPYLAAVAIRTLRIYEPDDPFGICEPMHAWCTQWEDEPDNRAAIDAAITTALSEFLTRNPPDRSS
ncbi:hypothetical protein IU427_04980 [Nocardia beijingensis]|uniref:hypothetical protein n=1 Tax=Nocardia beijingensis TaxID=95162 RepID=UPI0018958B7F|nr:hypothetical protein [Nocardia beijingensis]MBF6464534.1 hypothetical protein [Nocardia beijingensis]